MEKKELSRGEMSFLKSQVGYLKGRGILTEELEIEILEQYREREKINFLKIVLIMGAVLLGIGIVSFLAGNWVYIGDFIKVGIILFAVAATNVGALLLEEKSPKTSRALNYLGAIELGAGIILINNIFNMEGDGPNLFFYWGLGIVPLALATKDKAIGAFFSLLTIMYIMSQYGEFGTYPFWGILMTALGYLIVYRLDKSGINIFISNLGSIALISVAVLEIFKDTDIEVLTVFGSLFVIGMVMSKYPFSEQYKKIVSVQGHMVHGIAGIGLSVADTWSFSEYSLAISTAFAILYFLYLLYLIKKENLVSILFSGAIVLTLYLNLTYKYLHKSVIFIVSGAILMAFGYYFEKKRREAGRDELEQ